MTNELRYIPLDLAQLRLDNANPRRLVGYAVVWNSLSVDLGGFREMFAPGAFKEILADPTTDVLALINHDTSALPIGRQSAGTLRLWEDDYGLAFQIDVPNSRDDLLEAVARGDVKGMSFAFIASKEHISYDRSQTPPVRTVKKAERLFEVSPVSMPAYEATSVLNRTAVTAAEIEGPTIGNLSVTITADTSRFDAALKEAKAAAEKLAATPIAVQVSPTEGLQTQAAPVTIADPRPILARQKLRQAQLELEAMALRQRLEFFGPEKDN